MRNNIKSNVYTLLAIAVCFAAWSCSGEEGVSMPEVPTDSDALCAITPHAIEIGHVDVSQTPITRSATGEPELKATYAENLGVNYAAEVTLEAAPQEAQTRALGYLAAGAQYRIVVFNAAGEVKGDVVYKQGSTAVVSGKEIKLKAGTYRLFAYSFNSTSAIRGLDADKKNVTVNSGEDFMTYTIAGYTVASTDYSTGKQLNIRFTRQCTRLTVTLVIDGYPDNTITAASLAMGNVFGSGNKWNGTTNTDAATLASAAGTAPLTKATGNASSIDCGLGAYPYLITSPCSNKKIDVSGLSITIAGTGTKTPTPASFQLTNSITLAKGRSYKLTIYIYNAYLLTRTNPVMIGGIKLARTNLQQTGSGNSAPVSFVANPWDYGSRWSWGLRDATQTGGGPGTEWSITIPGDRKQNPCRSLDLSWRLPSKDEWNRIINCIPPNGTRVRINGRINTINNNFGWAPDAKGLVLISGTQVAFMPAYDSNGEQYWAYTKAYSNYTGWADILNFSNSFCSARGSHPVNVTIPLRCIQE